MSICKACNQEMTDPDVISCDQTYYYIRNGSYPHVVQNTPIITWLRLKWEPEGNDPDERCHDCGIATGLLHHPGCDVEICPRCRGQAISCDCVIQGLEPFKYTFLPDGTPVPKVTLQEEPDDSEPGHRPNREHRGPGHVEHLEGFKIGPGGQLIPDPAYEWDWKGPTEGQEVSPMPSFKMPEVIEESLKLGPGSFVPLPDVSASLRPEKWTEEAMWRAFDQARAMYADRGISPMMAWYEVAIQIRADLMLAQVDLANYQRVAQMPPAPTIEGESRADWFQKYATVKLDNNRLTRLLSEAQAQVSELEEQRRLVNYYASQRNRLWEELDWYNQTREACRAAWDEIEEEVDRLKAKEKEEEEREDG